MGRRRTLINGFGANWATGRVSVKNARLAGEYDGNSNCRSVVHRASSSSWSRTTPREDHCIKSYTRSVFRFSTFFFFFLFLLPCFPCFRVSFYFFFSLSHVSACFALIFGGEGRGGCTQRAPSVTVADSPQTRQGKKKGLA